MYIHTDVLTRRGSSPSTPLAGLGQKPPFPYRICCLLNPSGFIDPVALGTHLGEDEGSGILYTGAAGFIDIGHLRASCDTAKWAHDQIRALSGFPGTVNTPEGTATITRSIPARLWIAAARDIAFDDGLGHEIFTYWAYGPGGGDSSFSPEDLCSNHLGTYIAEVAINSLAASKDGLTFGAAVTAVLRETLKQLNAQSLTESRNAWTRTGGCWVGTSVLDPLTRRNFTIAPWKVGHPSDVATPKWLAQAPGAAAGYYTYQYKAPSKHGSITTSSFTSQIQKVRDDAKVRYGAKYDQPSCP